MKDGIIHIKAARSTRPTPRSRSRRPRSRPEARRLFQRREAAEGGVWLPSAFGSSPRSNVDKFAAAQLLIARAALTPSLVANDGATEALRRERGSAPRLARSCRRPARSARSAARTAPARARWSRSFTGIHAARRGRDLIDGSAAAIRGSAAGARARHRAGRRRS